MTHHQLGILILCAVKVLYNSNREDFNKIFGEEIGPHLWNKFVNQYEAREGEFIGSLDYGNLAKLAKAAVEFAKEKREL